MGEQGVRPRESQPDSSNCVYFHLWIVSSIFRFLGLKERLLCKLRSATTCDWFSVTW